MSRRGGKTSCKLCRKRWSSMRTLLPWGSFLVTKRCSILCCLLLTERKVSPRSFEAFNGCDPESHLHQSSTLAFSNPSVSLTSTSLREVHLDRLLFSASSLSPSRSGKLRSTVSESGSKGSTTSLTRLQLRAAASVVLQSLSKSSFGGSTYFLLTLLPCGKASTSHRVS
ncbi:hypothetical protein IWZ00DRAFT_87471 [Phyllosticta capitalensis]